MLRTDRFQDRERGTEVFWNLVQFLLRKTGGTVIKPQRKEHERRTWYLDTKDRALRQRGYVLRQRDQITETPRYKLTLKYRGFDRYHAAAQDISVSEAVAQAVAAEGGDAEVELKFEEDVLPPFASKYAHSVSIKTEAPPPVETVDQAVAVWPGLEALGIPPGTLLQTVNGFTAREIARWIGKVRFAKKPNVKACLSFWYLPEHADDLPLAAEFSFDYDLADKDTIGPDTLEHYPRHLVQGAQAFFTALQKQSGWANLSGTTKTAYAYDAF
jgi:hypothetical protein